MDPIHWSFNAIDKIYSTLSNGKADPSCPNGTHAAGYTNDPWGNWRLMCLAQLSVEDVEDVYLLLLLIFGFLTIGIIGYLNYQVVSEVKLMRREMMLARSELKTARGEPSDLFGKILRGEETLRHGLSQVDQKQSATLAHLSRMLLTLELMQKMDVNLERLTARAEGRLA